MGLKKLLPMLAVRYTSLETFSFEGKYLSTPCQLLSWGCKKLQLLCRQWWWRDLLLRFVVRHLLRPFQAIGSRTHSKHKGMKVYGSPQSRRGRTRNEHRI